MKKILLALVMLATSISNAQPPKVVDPNELQNAVDPDKNHVAMQRSICMMGPCADPYLVLGNIGIAVGDTSRNGNSKNYDELYPDPFGRVCLKNLVPNRMVDIYQYWAAAKVITIGKGFYMSHTPIYVGGRWSTGDMPGYLFLDPGAKVFIDHTHVDIDRGDTIAIGEAATLQTDYLGVGGPISVSDAMTFNYPVIRISPYGGKLIYKVGSTYTLITAANAAGIGRGTGVAFGSNGNMFYVVSCIEPFTPSLQLIEDPIKIFPKQPKQNITARIGRDDFVVVTDMEGRKVWEGRLSFFVRPNPTAVYILNTKDGHVREKLQPVF